MIIIVDIGCSAMQIGDFLDEAEAEARPFLAIRLGQGVKAIGKLADCVVWDTRPLITTASQEIVLHMRNSVI